MSARPLVYVYVNARALDGIIRAPALSVHVFICEFAFTFFSVSSVFVAV